MGFKTRIFRPCYAAAKRHFYVSKVTHMVNNGFFPCPSCGEKFVLEEEKVLQTITCVKCGCPVLQPSRIDDYLVFEPLGGGGMGSVYMCISMNDHHLYSIKLLPRIMKHDQICIDGLIKEGLVHEDISGHQNIVKLIKAGCDGDEYFVVSEFLKGERLDTYIATEAPISEKKCLDILLQLIDAEMHIISKGYLYRDMKPENVIVQQNGVVKLFDFGLSLSLKQAANPQSENHIIEGSPHYIPPERLVAEPEKEFSEIYSLGMMLFYLLSGRHYYTDKEINALARKHIFGLRVGSTAKQIAHISPLMAKVVDKMIQRYPKDRVQTLSELKEVLVRMRNI